MVLQITSMADVFTILLVFLLKNLAAGESSLNLTPEMTLPEAIASDQLTEALKIEITPKGVSLADHVVSELNDFQIDRRDMESNGTLRSLNNAFISQAKNRKPSSNAAKADANQNAEPPANDRRLLVLADKRTPYTTLKSVMDTAAGNGFAEFKLVVVEER
jgi:biopolymer transport protein ExbD